VEYLKAAAVKGATVVMRVVEMLEDDIDGGTAEVTVSFALEGKAYEIDLSNDNAQRLRDAMQPFLDAARPAPGTAVRQSRRSSAKALGESPAQIREWARENGYEVNERGRIPANIVAAYRAAHGG
jgi:hypothetical protein